MEKIELSIISNKLKTLWILKVYENVANILTFYMINLFYS